MRYEYNDAIKQAADMYGVMWDSYEHDENGDLLNRSDAIEVDRWLNGVCNGLYLGFDKSFANIKEDMLTAIYKRGY